jgi:hypothetical protein
MVTLPGTYIEFMGSKLPRALLADRAVVAPPMKTEGKMIQDSSMTGREK